MTTIRELFGLPDTKGWKSPHGVEEGLASPDQLIGVELEIENWASHYDECKFGGIKFTEDGSLRNNGIEAITKPIATKHARGLLTAFFNHYDVNDTYYSDRCSTHVHFNVQPLTLDQLSTICLVYQTVESLLFRAVGHDRENNIFCVPWNQCTLNYSVVNDLAVDANNVFRRWQKYAALNLIPVTSQGTIEFRHLHGTCDVDFIMNWVNIISSIFTYAQRVSLEEAKDMLLHMNTVSNYNAWMGAVFGHHSDLLHFPGYEKQLAIGVVDSKLMLMKKKKGDESSLAAFMRQERERAELGEAIAANRAHQRMVSLMAESRARPAPVPVFQDWQATALNRLATEYATGQDPLQWRPEDAVPRIIVDEMANTVTEREEF